MNQFQKKNIIECKITGNLLSILIHDQRICQQTFMSMIKNPCMGLPFRIVFVPETLINEQFSSTLLLFSTKPATANPNQQIGQIFDCVLESEIFD
jgi:hypothetical protein